MVSYVIVWRALFVVAPHVGLFSFSHAVLYHSPWVYLGTIYMTPVDNFSVVASIS